MIQALISLFGITIVYRNLSLLEKFEVMSKKKLSIYFVLLQLPLFLFIFFKEQCVFATIYIGIFLITLIFYRKILIIFAKNTYVNCHLQILDQLILHLKSGKSAQTSLKFVLSSFTAWEKLIFRQLESIFEIKEFQQTNLIFTDPIYFEEMQNLLRSNNNLIEQLKSFREALRIRHHLRHKSRQVTQQVRAQALISVFIYISLLFISFNYLNLRNSMDCFYISVILFCVGLTLIFTVGGKIKWKT